MVEGEGVRSLMKKQRTSFFKALISKDAREQRKHEILEEKERKKKFDARFEASALSWFWFLGCISVLSSNFLLGVLAIVASCAWWQMIYWLSYKYGPLIKGNGPSFGGKSQSVFFGPRGGRFRLSANGKRRIYF